ncbi:MAG: hypothetical protein JST32_08810, partial [Bacteroidetes bacterium]|nr:hypothetical protein [Bacteroidota bacterium]
MTYKIIITATIVLISSIKCLGQEVIEKKDRLNDDIIEKFMVLKDSTEVKNGQYTAFYHRRHL